MNKLSILLCFNIFHLVLSVGQLHPPNVQWEYMIQESGVQLSKVTYRWDHRTVRYSRCSHVCNGQMEKILLCIREDTKQTVADFRCSHLPRPPRIRFPCGDNCTLTWLTTWTSECSSACGKGTKMRTIECGKIFKKGGVIKYVSDDYCIKEHGAKPAERLECHGYCPVVHWVYSPWSECSLTCGGGRRTRTAQCYDNDNNRREEAECENVPRESEQSCNPLPCPEWRTSPWSACSSTCGKAMKYRTVSCTRDGRDVSYKHCDSSQKPRPVAECPFEACPRWTTGPWSQCQGRCDKGTHMRAVKCIAADGRTFLEDQSCSNQIRPIDVEDCGLPPCEAPPAPPTTPSRNPSHSFRFNRPRSRSSRPRRPTSSGSSNLRPPQSPAPSLPQRPSAQTYWRTGAWTSCSRTCGQGIRKRYVRCYDSVNNVKALEECSAPKPAEIEDCYRTPCGHWRTGKWNGCSVTCGEGVQKRLVKCIMLDKQTEANDCEMELRPISEQACNRQACVRGNSNFDVARIDNNEVVGTLRWLTWSWKPCSSSCGNGVKRRRVECHDENGPALGCDKRWRPRDVAECHAGPCPVWHYTEWGECSVTCGGGVKTRQVACQWRSGHPMPSSSCNIRERPFDTLRCNTQPCDAQVGKWPRSGVVGRSQWTGRE